MFSFTLEKLVLSPRSDIGGVIECLRDIKLGVDFIGLVGSGTFEFATAISDGIYAARDLNGEGNIFFGAEISNSESKWLR